MKIDAQRILACLEKVALLCEHDPVYWPIFDRLDAEYEAMMSHKSDPIARARARRKGHKAMLEMSS